MNKLFSCILAVWWGLFLSCYLTGCDGAGGSTPLPIPAPPLVSRKPSIFQAWNGDLQGLPVNENSYAKHDLVWHDVRAFGYRWPNNDYLNMPLLAYEATAPQYNIDKLRAINPGMKILGSVLWYELPKTDLPDPHPFWKGGHPSVGVPLFGTYRLDENNPDLQDFVAKIAKAFMATGKLDGIMLDRCNPETPGNMTIIRKVRAAIGPNALLIVNGNWSRLSPNSLANVNGVFMEWINKDPNMWDTLAYNEKNCRKPTHNCFEYQQASVPASPTDITLMEALVKRVCQTSTAHFLFSYGFNVDPQHHHDHNWYPIYDTVL